MKAGEEGPQELDQEGTLPDWNEQQVTAKEATPVALHFGQGPESTDNKQYPRESTTVKGNPVKIQDDVKTKNQSDN